MAENFFDQFDHPAPTSSGGKSNYFDQFDEKPTSRSAADFARDIAGTAINSAIGVPEAIVGLSDIPTGGAVGKFLENEGGSVGFRPKQAKEFVNESIKSDASREARRKFSEADGIVDKTVAAVQNPSLILEGVGESLGAMGAGGVASRGLMAATKLGQMGATGAALAGAAGEGITMAGSAAEQIRQETPDGLLTPTQAGLAVATGVAGSAIGAVGGRVTQKLGIGDAETLLAQGTKGMAKANADDAARAVVNPLVQQQAVKSIPRRVIEGAISEGFLEELPQSVAEQVFQNVALGKDWLQDVDAAVVMGVLSGSAMGGAAAGYHGIRQPKAGEPGAAPGNVPPAGGEQPSDGARNPGLDRIQQSFADQLAALQQQEQGEPAVPQTAPPDGAAVLAQQQAAEAARRQAAIDASRAVASPDDEIYQSTGAAVPRSVAMGLDPAAGPLSASAALAVDSGASDQIQRAAALAQAAEVAQKQGKKPAQSNKKQERKTATQQGVNPETGEILQDTPIDSWTDAQLSEVFRGAQSREVRMQLAKELGRRRDLREQQELQAELDAEQRASVPGAERADAAFASLTEDAGEVPADLTNPATTEGNRNGPQAAQAQQDRAQPPQVGAAPAVASAAPASQGRGSAQGAGAAGVAGGTETANAGAQAAPAAGAQAAATAEGSAQRVADTGDAWTRMPTTERQALAQRADLKPIVRKNVHRAAWADLNRDVQRKLADAMGGRAETGVDKAAAPTAEGPISNPTFAPEITQQAQAATENVASNTAGQDEKARWLKSVADMNRMSGQFGAQIDGVANGRLSVVGNPNATKQGRALMAAVDEARRAGATNEEIAQAAAGRATTAPQPTSPTAGAPAEGVGAVEAPAQETTHNGTRIYPTKIKVGDEVKSMWAVESPDNQRRRAAGERAIGGDSLHDTLEQAKSAAERESKRDAEQQAAKAERDAADKARLDAEEARKAANRPKTVVERRKDAILDGPSKIGQGTKRAVITTAVDNGYAIEAKMVYDHAAKKRDQEAVDRASRAGYILGVSNENLPLVKAGNEAKARLKEGKYEKPEYRVYQGSDTKAPFREITKTEYDYAQELKAQRASAQQAEAAQPAITQQADNDFLPEGWTKSVNGYTKREQEVAGRKAWEQERQAEDLSEYPFGKLEAADTDEFHGLRVRVLPEMTGDSAWEGEVGMVLKHGRLLEVMRDGRDFRVRVPGDRVEVLTPRAVVATTPAARFEQLRANGGEQAPFKAFGAVAGTTGEPYTDVWSRWHSVMGFMDTVKTGTGEQVAAKMQAQLLKEPWANEAVYPGDGRGMAADAPLQAWRNRADKVDKHAESFASELDREELRARDAENFGVPDDAVSKARAAVAEMRKRAAKAVQETKDGLAKAEERAKAEEAAEAKAYQDTFEAPSQSVLAKKPTPASITNWSKPTELRGQNFYTNGHFVDATGTPPHINGWENRIGIRPDIPASQMERVLGLAGVRNGAMDNTHVKAEPLALINDKKQGRMFFDVGGELVAIDLTYAQYFVSKVKGATFTANPNDLNGALRVMDGDKLIGIVMPIRMGANVPSVGDVRGYMKASGKDKPMSVVARRQADMEGRVADAQADAAEQPTKKLTPAEAKSLMAWQDLGQKDGVKTHALTFYESQADKDAKRGRMIVAKVSKGDRSATAWMVDGEDKTFGMLAQAKKLAEEVGMAKAVADGFVEQGAPAPANDRNAFTLQRLNRETGQMEPVAFERGEYVRYTLGGKDQFGDIDGISQARKEFSVDGLWYPFGFAYKAERPAAPKADAVPLSSVIDKVNAKNGQGLTDTDRVPGATDIGWDAMSQEQRTQILTAPSGWSTAKGGLNVIGKNIAKRDWADIAPATRATIERLAQKLETTDAAPASKTPMIDRHNVTMAAVRDGKATAEQFRASFEQVVDGKAAIVAELDTMTKAQMLREGGPFVQMRYANEKKADVVDAVYREMVGEYALGESVTYGMGRDSYQNAVRKLVEATDADKLAQYVKDRQDEIAEAQARGKARAAALENPKTLSDFRDVLNAKIREGMTRKEAFLTLTPQQRIQYDTLEAESTREARETRKRAQKTEVRAAGQTTAGEIVATKHTRDGYDLFVVKLAERLSADDYKTVLASAKKLGGWYSAFRGNGAIPGFQFKDKANAEAFLALAGGDTTAAQEQVAQRRDAFEDDRSQTAVERLRAMADKLEEGAAEVEGQQRKTNTERRARFASAAMASAAADKAKAQTMRNIARAIEGGEAKFLDAVRTKSQVDMLTGIVDTAKGAELRAKYPSYADQEKRKGEPPTAETADFAEFPSYSAFRSDLATLGRQLLEVDGTKKLGQRLMSVADDVTDSYLEFAKANFQDVSRFGRGDALADFASKDEAERAIKRSGLTGKAIVLPIKRGQNRVILSPSEAIGRGLWQGDGDKRITLTAEFGAELVEAIGRRGNKQNQLAVPWQFQNAYDRRKALSRIGIETPSEFRAALREFIGLKEQAVANRTRAMELQMVGRKADGLDFFPTSAEVADQMIEAADLSPDMAVLEPSAGMGHLADRIREAGAEPDVIEISADRRELLEEKGYITQAVDDFLDLKPREFYTFGDTFRAPDGAEGIMRGANGSRVKLVNQTGDMVGAGYYDRADLTGVAHNGTASGYDRIIMNPPFSNRRDAEHVRHAYSLLKPGGRIVAIMGEGVFFGQDKKAQDFRDWLESVGGTSEKLPEGSFMDPSLPVNTSVNARMVVIDRADGVAMFSSADATLPAKPLSLDRVNQLVQEALAGIRGAPPVEVTARPADVGLQVPAGSVGYGVTLRSGDIYVFQSAMGSDLDVFKTVFHELFHRGVRVLVPKAQYVQTMLDLAKGDSRIQQLAIEWKNTEMGQKQKDNLRKQGYTGAELTGQYEALAIEEALAAVAEEIKAEGRLGSKPKNMTIRFLANWLAKLADLAGMKKLAAGIRAMTYNEAERFVMSAIDRSGEPVQAGRTDNLSAKQAARVGDQTQTESFKRWFKDSKVVDAEGKPQSAVQTTPEEAEAGDGSPGDVAAFRRDGAESSERATEFDVDSFLKAMGRPSAYSEAAQRQAIDSVSATVDAIRTAWGPNAPEVVVAFDMQDERIPEAARKADLRQRSGGARGAPEGFYYRGKAYLMASRLNTPNDAARVLYHEVLGHHGLRGKFGRDLDQVLNQIVTMRKAEVAAKMQEYGLRGVNGLRVREAAEEVLAEMAEKNPQLQFVQRAISAIRNFLRAHVPGFQSMRLTDSDIIQAYILPARGWVERGGGPGGGQSVELGFSRSDDTPLREASTFTEARVAAQEFQGKALVNEATGLQANVSRNTLDKMLSRKAVEKSASAQAQSRAVANLDRLYQGAIFGWSKEDRDGNTNVRAVHRFFVPMDMDGRVLMAKLTVKETVDANHANPLYTVEAVDFNEKSPAAMWVDASAKADGIDLTSIRSAGEVLSLAQEIEQRNAEDDGETMFSRSKMEGLGASAMDLLQQTMRHEGKVSLWDKTVGTMRNLAERSPVFKPVYEAAQRFIDDVSMLGNDAADRAPRLLPRVETLADLKKKPITAADNQAVAKPLFEGTLLWARDVDGTPVTTEALNAKYRNSTPDEKAQILLRTGKIQERMLKAWRGLPVDQFNTIINNKFDSTILKPGVVWTAKELQDLFGLNAQQVSLYQEARAAIDRSIDMTARADMLRALGADYADLREPVLGQASLEDAMVLITDTLQAEAREAPDQADRILSLNNAVVKSHERAQALMDAGYAPLSRFGRYTVDVVGKDGTREYFGMFESVYESNKMKAAMEKEFPGATVTQGTMSDEAFKLFQGITPESLEQFGNMLGLSGDGDDAKDKAFQAYLQLAKNNHSALKRLIHRKGISGYSEDVGRVLASFVYSNARLAAGGLNAGTLEKAIEGIPKEQGELRDVAMGLRSYIQDPQEEGQAVRGMLFAQYLGGSVASAVVNMTQPFQITMPWLSQFGGMRSAASHLAGAVRDMTRRSGYEPDLAKALHTAEAEGIVSPQEIHQLMAQARGAGSLRTGDGTKMGDARATAANNWERVKVAWGQPFALAEQFNRRSTFIAAYRMAKEQGMADPAKFAERAVLETQFVYSKANKPKWARGTIGGTLFTFKTYSVSYLELMHRMWTQGGPEGKRAVGWAVAMLLLMGGAGGLPFMEDAEDLIDGAGQLMGYNVSTKQWRKQLMRDTIGKELADFVENGVSGLPGAPIDVSGRLGMGNLIPGTGLLLSKQSRERDLLEVAGPAGDLVARGFTGARKVLTGDLAGAALEVSPTAVRNAFKGADMATSGIYKDTKGYKVIDTTLDEAISKAIGFQPKSVAEVQEANSFMQRSKSFYIQTSSDIKAQWAQAVFEKDDAALQRVRDRLAAWNRNNPDQPIVVKIPDVMKRVREMGKDRTERIADTAPKALRDQMRSLAREAAQGPA